MFLSIRDNNCYSCNEFTSSCHFMHLKSELQEREGEREKEVTVYMFCYFKSLRKRKSLETLYKSILSHKSNFTIHASDI